MRGATKFLLFFVALAIASAFARRWIAPDLLPISDSELPNWKFQLAFVFQSLENMGVAGTGLSLLAFAAAALQKLLRWRKTPGEREASKPVETTDAEIGTQ